LDRPWIGQLGTPEFTGPAGRSGVRLFGAGHLERGDGGVVAGGDLRA
jgi:hypothetical protein